MENNLQDENCKEVLDDSKGVLAETPYIDEGNVTPIHMLSFAKKILLVLAIMFVIAAFFEFYRPGNAVFETCKVTLPSIATLVIGYYFGSTR